LLVKKTAVREGIRATRRRVAARAAESVTRMALRQYADRTGCLWNVWTVNPAAMGHPIPGELGRGWICFQRADGGDRFRLALSDAPPDWEELPSERLDLLRRLATVSPQTGPMRRIPRPDGTAEEGP
jgi:hypothetical protein